MGTLHGKTALVIGGSAGVGKATVKALLAEGATVTAVARGADRLRALSAEVGQGVSTLVGDASDPTLATRLLRELRPDCIVLAGGVTPKTAPLDEHDWESFSEPWNRDLKAAFHVFQAALALPLAAGSTIVSVSSGAAIDGSPLSGGYAGAKRMQWFLTGYAQKLSDAKQLGIRAITVVPKQLIEGTAIAAVASTAYGAKLGLTPEAFMKRFDKPLHPEQVAAAILSALRGEVTTSGVMVTGAGVEPIA